MSGQVFNAETGALAGKYQLPSLESWYGVVPDASVGRVYFITGPSNTGSGFPTKFTIRASDQQTFLRVGSLDIPNVLGGPTALVRWGTNGLAFRTDRDRVYLLRNSLIAPPTGIVTPAPPTRVVSGSVVVSNVGGLGGVTLSLSGSATGSTVSASNGSFSFDGLPLCGTYTATPSKELYSFAPPSRTLTAADNNNPNSATAFFDANPYAFLFGQSVVTVGEGTGGVTLSVFRTGDLSKSATVDYQTSDGTASERADYNAAVGTLSFAAGESAKTIRVFITDDARAEPPETFTATLSNPTGALLGTFSTEVVTINDNDAADGTTSPADDAAFFVRQHYRDFLNRDPDASGLNFWTNEITSCGSDAQCREVKRINVSAAFFLSIEFQETGYLAYRSYKTAFGGATSPGVEGTVPVIRLREFLADGQRIGQGVIVGQGDWQRQLESNKQAYALEFVQRSLHDGFPRLYDGGRVRRQVGAERWHHAPGG